MEGGFGLGVDQDLGAGDGGFDLGAHLVRKLVRPLEAGAGAVLDVKVDVAPAAGATGALVYSLHCLELAAPFLGSWYLLGMLIPTVVGVALGPRVLRW